MEQSENRGINPQVETYCNDCGFVYGKQLAECPNCGCPNESTTTPNTKSKNKSANTGSSAEFIANNVWTAIIAWLKPRGFKIISNTSPKMESPKVDNDGEEVLDTNISLWVIIQAFSLKLFWRLFLRLTPILIIQFLLSYVIINEVMYWGELYVLGAILLWLLGMIIFILSFLIVFKIFIRTLIEYWDHLYLRFKELNIRYWRSMYKAMKDVKE